MRGRKCSLCGGRLNHDNICTECGLDNTKSDANYDFKQDTADYGKLTHTHQSAHTHSWEEKTVQRQSKNQKKKNNENVGKTVSKAEARRMMQQAKRSFEQHGQTPEWERESRWHRNAPIVKRKRRMVRIMAVLVILFMLCGIIPGIISMVLTMGQGDLLGRRETEYEENYHYDPYQFLTKEFRDGGETYNTVLKAGEYIVGVHLPEGRYTVKGEPDDYGMIWVNDTINHLYMSYNMDEDNGYEQEDVRLFLGAHISLSAELEFESENAQISLMASRENPLTESILLGAGQTPTEEAFGMETVTVGEVFEAGVYDLVITKGVGSVNIEIPNEQGDSLDTIYVWLDEENDRMSTYKNVVLPEGAEVTRVEEDVQIMLVPSERILNTDYMSYYTGEYLEQEPLAELLKEDREFWETDGEEETGAEE